MPPSVSDTNSPQTQTHTHTALVLSEDESSFQGRTSPGIQRSAVYLVVQ